MLAVLFSASDSSQVPVDLKLSEDASSNSTEFWVTLSSEPTNDVTITFTSTDFSDIGLGTDVFDFPLEEVEQLVFTAADWSVPQDIVLRALNDVDVERVHHVPIDWEVSSLDLTFDQLSGSIDTTIYDDDTDLDLLIINEFVANHNGTDTNEYVEIKNLNDSSLGSSFAPFYLLQVDGDGVDQGQIDSISTINPGLGAGAYEVINFNNQVEDGSLTWILVEGFDTSLTVGSDLDLDNDGELDLPLPWTAVAGSPRDAISIDDGDAGDGHYSRVILDPDFDAPRPGSGPVVGGVSRLPDGFIEGTSGAFRTAAELDDRFGWDFADGGSIHANWDVLTVPVGDPGNFPDIDFVGSGFNSVLKQTVPTAFITSSGNIYSFADQTDFDVTVDTSDLSGSRTRVVVQWRTLGSEVDYDGVNIGGVAPTYVEFLSVNGPQNETEYLALWDFDAAPESSYLVEFMASGSSMSLAAFQADAYAQNIEFADPAPYNPYVRNNPSGLPFPGVDIIPGMARNTPDAVNELLPGLMIIETDSSTDLDESAPGTVDSYQIYIGTDPTDAVTVNITADAQQQIAVDTDGDGDSSDETFSGSASFVFGINDGNSYQTIFVRVVDDATVETDSHTGVIMHAATSNDPDYSGVSAFPKKLSDEIGTAGDTISVSITDDDGDTSPPIITDVIVASSSWSSQFIDFVDDGLTGANNQLGLSLVGGGQLRNLPWLTGIDTVYIVFSEDVGATFTAANVSLIGTSVADYLSGGSVAFGAAGTNTGTVSLSNAITADAVVLSVFDLLTDSAGNQLDGEWVDAVDTMSGDGTAGGQFNFRIDVLAGDATDDGAVNLTGDVLGIFTQNGNTLTDDDLMDAFFDIDASGAVNLTGDVLGAFGLNGSSLPAPPPPPTAGVGASFASAEADEVFRSLAGDESVGLLF
ncbi:MAG: hypothetical protein AAGJ40_22275 [Planctomycetota bacterium]